MKIQCDVCEKDEASLFCVADEAALCTACDHRVHHANKLAGKHQRFSLHYPSSKQAPLCDICQERRAFLFCQQDRAILCRECDVPIHKANQHTQKHARFLLTGVKLSAIAALYSASQSSAESGSSTLTNNNVCDAASNFKSQESKNKPAPPIGPPMCAPSTAKGTTGQSTQAAGGQESSCARSGNVEMMNEGNLNGSISASSISEYLIEMLPGWHVEDFLDSSSNPSPSPYGFCKSGESDLLQIWDADLASSNMSGFPTEKVGSWVPQMHQTQINQSYQSTEMMGFGTTNGFRQQSKEFTANNVKPSRIRNEDNSFAVPQIRPSSAASKRSRTLW
ncbi:B-box zinc finger protein 20 [Sesamum indicum]|uniref:B-box zinc finger protein 20 n=1 Tax=Sesamum indicum TaxID=4182 RepID=A0A6I9T3V0_SESIN|nr:B-box zinc finger protein 20 [Sesamum indicum]